jgi:hypothetical protein
MYEQLKGKGLIVFSDPAGAKACLALAALLRIKNPSVELILLSNRSYDFYKDWQDDVQVISDYTQAPDWSDCSWLFTGTSRPDSSDSFELYFIAAAAQHHISSWSFIDHWRNYSMRFLKQGEWILPDHVLVLDSEARTGAVSEGIPAERIQVLENPYLTYIAEYWHPYLSREQLLQTIPVSSTYRKIALYAPDPITLIQKDQFFLFDEVEVLQTLIAVLDQFPQLLLLLKLHPLQPPEKILEVLKDKGSSRIQLVPAGMSNLELIHASDLVIGFHSNFLLEAQALGKQVIRYYPSEGLDSLAHLTIGKKITNIDDLITSIDRIYSS